MNKKLVSILIRGVDKELWTLARIEAIKQGLTLGQFINKLLKDRLKPKP